MFEPGWYDCYVCSTNGSVKMENGRADCFACSYVHLGEDPLEHLANDELLEMNRICKR